MTRTDLIEEARKLPVEERIELANSLWESIEKDADQLPLYDWQREILEERLQEARANPEGGVPWEQAKLRLQEMLAERA